MNPDSRDLYFFGVMNLTYIDVSVLVLHEPNQNSSVVRAAKIFGSSTAQPFPCVTEARPP